jgi:hypothetical protein
MDCMTLCVYVCIAPVTACILEDDPPDYFSPLYFGF